MNEIISRKNLLWGMVILAFVTFLCLGGCGSSTKKNTAIGLMATKDVFVAAATSAKRLCETGVIDNEDCGKIQDIYNQGRNYLLQAKQIWDGMVVMDSFYDSGEYDKLLIEVSKLTVIIEGIIRKNTGD